MSESPGIETDVVVIGAGAVGENVADRVVQGGLACTIVEQNLVGGECSYWACMPSKALLRPIAALKAARRVQGAASAVTGSVDPAAVFARRDSFTSNWNDAGQVTWLDGAGISLVRGRGSIAGPRTVRVSREGDPDQVIRARHAVVLATGSTPVVPPIAGLETVPFWGTREATSAHEVPGRMAVIGGGVAAVELAQVFANLGSTVTILARSGLLGKFPLPAVSLLTRSLEEDGVEIRTGTTPTQVASGQHGEIELSLGDGETLKVDRLLVSTGRTAAVHGLGIETVGIDPGTLEIDDTGLIHGVEGNWLYAVGDAAGKVQLTHQGKYEARATGDAIAAIARGEVIPDQRWTRERATADAVAVPSVVFTDPEVAHVGLTEDDARKQFGDVLAIDIAIDVAGAGLLADDYEGWAQIVIDVDRRVIVGATFAGQDVAELLHGATIAIVGEVPLNRLWHAVPSYPAVSEVWLRLLEATERQWGESHPGTDPFRPLD